MEAAPTEAEGVALEEHFHYLERLRDERRLIVAGPSVVADDTFGLVVLAIEDEAEARSAMNADPAVVAGVMNAELRPLRLSVVRP
jgi:uncharacterized protein YciI